MKEAARIPLAEVPELQELIEAREEALKELDEKLLKLVVETVPPGRQVLVRHESDSPPRLCVVRNAAMFPRDKFPHLMVRRVRRNGVVGANTEYVRLDRVYVFREEE